MVEKRLAGWWCILQLCQFILSKWTNIYWRPTVCLALGWDTKISPAWPLSSCSSESVTWEGLFTCSVPLQVLLLTATYILIWELCLSCVILVSVLSKEPWSLAEIWAHDRGLAGETDSPVFWLLSGGTKIEDDWPWVVLGDLKRLLAHSCSGLPGATLITGHCKPWVSGHPVFLQQSFKKICQSGSSALQALIGSMFCKSKVKINSSVFSTLVED